MSRGILLILLILVFPLVAAQAGNINIAAGVPTKANDSNFCIIERSQYTTSISKALNVANWVSYHLCEDDFGITKRYSKKFITDTTLPLDYYKVKHSDYTNSGYDRGHLVRSEERTRTDSDNISTFYLTNIIPQTPDLNRLVWLQFEKYCQTLCISQHKHLFIVTGGAYYSDKKLKGKVSVPDSCWKVVLILDSNQTLGDVNKNTETIAVMMPNIKHLKKRKWDEFTTTIRHIEQATGYNFFSNINPKIQDIIENKRRGS